MAIKRQYRITTMHNRYRIERLLQTNTNVDEYWDTPSFIHYGTLEAAKVALTEQKQNDEREYDAWSVVE